MGVFRMAVPRRGGEFNPLMQTRQRKPPQRSAKGKEPSPSLSSGRTGPDPPARPGAVAECQNPHPASPPQTRRHLTQPTPLPHQPVPGSAGAYQPLPARLAACCRSKDRGPHRSGSGIHLRGPGIPEAIGRKKRGHTAGMRAWISWFPLRIQWIRDSRQDGEDPRAPKVRASHGRHRRGSTVESRRTAAGADCSSPLREIREKNATVCLRMPLPGLRPCIAQVSKRFGGMELVCSIKNEKNRVNRYDKCFF